MPTMPPYTPQVFRKGDRTEVANSLGEETDLRWDGWLADDGTPYTPPSSFTVAEWMELKVGFTPKWAPNTAYASGELVFNPSGQLVTANAAFTSGATYNAANWTLAKTTTAMMNPRSVTEDKLSVPSEGSNGFVLTYDNTQAGQMKWAPANIAAPTPGTPNSIALVANDILSATANSAAWAAYVADNTRGPQLLITEPGVYYFSGSMDCTNLTNPILRLYRGAGVELVQTRATTASASPAYGPYFRGALEAAGNVTTIRYFTADAARNSNTITLDNVAGIIGEGPDEPTGSARDMLTAGTVLYLCSDDLIHSGGKYRNSDLRRVVSVSGNTVTLDAPLYRNYTTANKALAVVATLHPQVVVDGPGRIRHNDSWANGPFYASLLRFEFCYNPIVTPDVVLGPGPGSGVDLHSCWGGRIEPNTEFLLSDDAIGNNADTWHPSNLLQVAHYGYGVAVGGASRNFFIGGTSHHVRHAFTTAALPDVKGIASITTQTGGQASNGGDPCYGTIAIRAWNTWQQAYDTHEGGHDLHFDASGLGVGTWDDTVEEAQQASINIRTSDCTITGRVSGGALVGVILSMASLANDYGQTVLRDLSIGPSPEAIRITGAPSGSRVVLDGVRVTGCPQVIRTKGGNPIFISGEGNFADGTGLTETASKRIVFSDAAVPATSNIDIGMEYVGYATVVAVGTSGLSSANLIIRRPGERGAVQIVYDITRYPGTGWPAVRPQVRPGFLQLFSPVAGVAAPSWLLDLDGFEIVNA